MSEEKRTVSKERRFVAQASRTAKLRSAGTYAGGLVMGAGFYAQMWMSPTPSYAMWLLGGGALLTIGATLVRDEDAAPIRVGSQGIAVERGGEHPERLLWCEVEKIVAEGDAIVAYGNGIRIAAGLPHHGAAAAWMVTEGLGRISMRVQVPPEVRDKLPKTSDHPGTLVEAEPIQVAGRRCKASGKLISFEDDARLCPRCGEVYHRDHEGKTCVTCEAAM